MKICYTSTSMAEVKVEAPLQQTKTEGKLSVQIDSGKRTNRPIGNPIDAHQERQLTRKRRTDEAASQAQYTSTLAEVQALTKQSGQKTEGKQPPPFTDVDYWFTEPRHAKHTPETIDK